jgi:SAM-dependent methyltransferase
VLLPDFHSLLTPTGQQALRAAVDLQPGEADFLPNFDALCRSYPPALARAALEVAILRREAAAKFPRAERMYFTRPALEQASNHAVASYRARRFTGLERLVDLGCSVGGDTASLAELAPTLGIDNDPLRLAMAQANLQALALSERSDFIQADLLAPLPVRLTSNTGLFFDPARRAGHKRIFSVRHYHPPLEVILNWRPSQAALGVKISPGVDLAELAGYDAETEFISLQGELKEAALWFGPLRTALRRATILPGAHTLYTESDELEPAVRLSPPRAWLYEPDPAILRARLVRLLAERIDAAQLDPDIAYLTGDQRIETPFARAWAVEAWFPFGIKHLRAELRQRGVSQVVIKKRGSPVQPEDLLRQLRLRRAAEEPRAERVVFLTHLRGQPIVVLCFP